MDAFELLKKDHKKVSELFEQIEKASSGASKKKIFSQLKGELDVHARVEEEIFYPALENKEESRDITLEAYEEHKVVKDLLAELAAQAHSDEWDAKLTVLKENVEHHVEEEEGELFDKAEKVLSDEQIERLGAEMEAEKAPQQRAAGATRKTANAKKSAKASPPARKQSGVLERFANFIGLGTQPANAAKRTAPKKGGAKKASKATSSAKAGKTSPTKKTAKKAAKKSAAKASSKKTSKKAGKSAPSRKTVTKTTKKAAKKK